MSLSLLLPFGLIALAGLLAPLLIHLVRRSELTSTDFAALRWLADKARPRRRLRFDELPLLALRLLLIALLAMALAQPVLHGWERQRDWLLVVPGAQADVLPGEYGGENIERRWLAPGFPPLSGPMPRDGIATASLLRELDARLPAETSLTVVAPAELGGLDGERLRLGRKVDWRVVAGRQPDVKAPPGQPLRLALRHAPGREPELRYLRAAMAAWNEPDIEATAGSADASERLPDELDDETLARATTAGWGSAGFAGMALVEEFALAEGAAGTSPAPPADTDWLLWLSSGPWSTEVEHWIAAGGQVLRIGSTGSPAPDRAATVWRSDETGAELHAWATGRGRVVQLPMKLTPADLPELLDPDFPDLLRRWLSPPPVEPARAPAAAHTPLTGVAAPSPPGLPLHDWLALLIAALFLVERWLASARGRQP